MEKEYKFVIATQCATFNQAEYILDTLQGFTFQSVHFPTVYCIVDDASTDGEQEILEDWANNNLLPVNEGTLWHKRPYGRLAVGQLENNLFATFVVLLLYVNHSGPELNKKKYSYLGPWCNNAKYIAFCEGDDFWTDPCKLEKQVDILDSNPDITLVYSSFTTVDAKGEVIRRPLHEGFKKKSISGETLFLLLRSNFIVTLTVCMRSSLLQETVFLRCPIRMDWSIFLVAAMYGNLCYLPVEMGSYRKVSGSMVNSHRELVDERGRIIKAYYSEKYLEKHYKTISFSQHIRILCSIADTCIEDRNWKLIKKSIFRPLFFIIFVLKFVQHSIRKCVKIINGMFK